MRACQCQCVVTADDEAQSEAGTLRAGVAGVSRGVAAGRRQAEAERQRAGDGMFMRMLGHKHT